MHFLRYLLTLAVVVGLFSATAAMADEQDGSRFDEELNERDFDALRDFLKAKRALDISESCDLSISGDVRTEWRNLNETCRGQNLRGGDATALNGRPLSRNDFDIEFNLRFDYVTKNTWAAVHVRYDNSAGVDDNGHPCGPNIAEDCKGTCKEQARRCVGDPSGYHGSGNCDNLCLKKAYFGYNIFTCGDDRFDVELGRRGNIYNVFDSNIQYLSRFDGILFKYQSNVCESTDWYIQAAGFLVDERVNHFGWIAEVGFLNICDSSLDFKYSFIDWEKNGKNRCFVRKPAGFRFLNSQWLVKYHLNPEFLGGVKTRLYAAFMINHAAENLRICGHNHGKQNIGWYAGILVGEVRKEGDWAVEVQYQLVQAQAMPDDDMGGIGRGNTYDESFTSCARRGNTNFQGWKLEGLYAVTDNITLDSIIEWSKAADKHIGGRHTYSKFELEAIYAF